MSAEVAVIIGSGSIGVAIGRAAGIGRKVLLADYSEETMNTVAVQLRGEGYEVTTHPIDISNHDAVAALADAAASLGDVTRVVLAAGVSPVQATTERVLKNPVVSAPIVGVTKEHHLNDAAGALDIDLTDDEVTALEEHYATRLPTCY